MASRRSRILCALLALCTSACGGVATAGRLPDSLALDSTLTAGRSSADDVLAVLGPRRGDGRARLPVHDETRDVSNLVNLLLDPGTPPLRWLGTGQRVPDDLGLPEPEALVERVMGGAP